MHKLSIREFHRQLYAVFSEPCEVSKDGAIIGYWMPKTGNEAPPAVHAETEDCLRAEESPKEALNCIMCDREGRTRPADFAGDVWNDITGEEQRAGLCEKHYKGLPRRGKVNFRKI